ncbi:TIGR00266 family protein [Methyloglobulus sp.]|uniref:TIGR00266 family protein n=1 Tax=Methyloglobulus sp. TaxID=2518622 RepID=UPI003989F795
MTQLNYTINGNDLQYIKITLDAGQEALAEQGAMMYTDKHIVIDTLLGDGSPSRLGALGRFWNAVKRSFTGESMFSSVYRNTSNKPQTIAIAAPSPGEIVPINLTEHGGMIICQKGAYIAGERGQKIQLAFQKRLRVGFFGGEGFIMQKISGQGIVFIHASGTLKEVTLSPDDELKVDTGCLVGLSSTARYNIKYTGTLKNSLFGGEGLFYATVSGPGKVWIQSLPMNRLSKVLMGAALTGSSSRSSWMGKFYLLAIILFAIATIYAKP